MSTEPAASCSFCGKNENEVKHLVTREDRRICNECLDLCSAILAEELENAGQRQASRRFAQPFVGGGRVEHIARRCALVSKGLARLSGADEYANEAGVLSRSIAALAKVSDSG